jgi:hypothetical protein
MEIISVCHTEDNENFTINNVLPEGNPKTLIFYCLSDGPSKYLIRYSSDNFNVSIYITDQFEIYFFTAIYIGDEEINLDMFEMKEFKNMILSYLLRIEDDFSAGAITVFLCSLFLHLSLTPITQEKIDYYAKSKLDFLSEKNDFAKLVNDLSRWNFWCRTCRILTRNDRGRSMFSTSIR